VSPGCNLIDCNRLSPAEQWVTFFIFWVAVALYTVDPRNLGVGNRKGHQALLVAVGRVSPVERDVAVLQCNEVGIGYSYPVGVEPEIVEYLLRAPKGGLQ
jgi:hypothetical protein